MCLQCRRPGFYPRVRKIPWGREWQPTPVFLPGEFHGQKLQSMGLQKVRHNWATNTHVLWSPRAVSRFLSRHWGRLRQPPVSPREPHLCHSLDSHVEFFFFKKVRGSNILKSDIGTSLVGSVVKNPPSNAGDTGSIPGWWSKIPYALGQLSLHTTATDPQCLNYDLSCSCACMPQLFLTQPKMNK